MRAETAYHIQKIAQLVKSKLPVDFRRDSIEDICRKCGLKIKYTDITDTVQKTPDEEVYVYLSENQSEPRQRYALARELGFLILHMGYLVNETVWDREGSGFPKTFSVGQTLQANFFADNLLMDKYEFTDQYKYTGPRKTAEYFDVPLSKVKRRAQYLGLTGNEKTAEVQI